MVRGITLLFHDHGTRRGWSAARPGLTLPPGKTRYPFYRSPRAGLDGRKISSHWDLIPDRPARSQSLYRLSYRSQIVGSGTALLFHDRGTGRWWVVSSTLRPHFTPGKDPVPIVQEAGWAPGPVWTGVKSRPLWDSIPDRPARSQSLYRPSYPAHVTHMCYSLYTEAIQKHKLTIVRIPNPLLRIFALVQFAAVTLNLTGVT